MHTLFSLSVLLTSALAHPQFPKKGGEGSATGGCSPLEIVIARATTESVGYGIVGGPYLRAVQGLIPGTTGCESIPNRLQ